MHHTSAQIQVRRPGLAAVVNDALDRGAVVLVADAGFGKTSLLEEAVGGRDGHTIWLNVSPIDRDPGRLLARLVDVVRLTLPGIAAVPGDRLAGAVEPIDVLAVTEDLAADLKRLVVDPLTLVIDDAEHVAGTPAAQILEVLLRARLAVAIASRRALGFGLARLRARGAVRELRSEDLAFSAAECDEYLTAATGRDADEATVDRLVSATDGWPLGVALAARHGVEGTFTARGRGEAFGFLREEVLDALEPELREAVLSASIVAEVDPLVERALELPPRLRDGLARQGVHVRDIGGGYALNPLLRELALVTLAEERPARERGALHARLAEALEAAGRAVDAIDHWIEAEEHERAAAALVAHGSLLANTAPDTVGAWLARLPTAVRERPLLQMLAGRTAMGVGRFAEAAELCSAGVAGLEREGAPEAMLWLARTALSDALITQRRFDEAMACCAGADTAGPDAGPGAVGACLFTAAVLALVGRVDESQRMLRAGLDHPLGPVVLAGTEPAFYAHYYERRAGRLDDALAHVEAGAAALERSDPFNRLPFVHVFRMYILQERGEPEAALEAFADALALARERGLAGYVGVAARLSAAATLAGLGRDDEARQQLDRAPADWDTWGCWDADLARARLAARDGDMQNARASARAAVATARQFGLSERARTACEAAPILCATGDSQRAREELEQILREADAHQSTARLRLALACIAHDAGDAEAARDHLVTALAAAGDQARYPLRCEWPRARPVVWRVLEDPAVDPAAAIAALDGAFPGGAELAGYATHPRIEVRLVALTAAAAAGRPDAIAALDELARSDDAQAGAAAAAARDRLVLAPPPLTISVLGRFVVRRGSWIADGASWERRAAERAVRLLLVRGGQAVPEDELIECLWPERPASRRGLQTAISSARAVLDFPGTPSLIEAGDRTYRLRLEAVTVDAEQFGAAASRALAARDDERVAALEHAARLWTGEPLPEERYSDWAALWRETLVARHADVLMALHDEHTRLGDHHAAVRAARQLVDADPVDEHAHRLLIGAFSRAGRRGHALRQFLACRRVLLDELGLEPAAATQDLHRRILAGDPV